MQLHKRGHALNLTFQSAIATASEALAPSASARRDAEMLLMHVTGRDRAYLLTHPEAPLSSEEQARFDSAIARRAAHEPIQYITGTQEFYGLAFAVTPAVLIPRPETEHLVEAALERIAPQERARIADVGTGSGAIAVVLAHYRPLAQVTALDIAPAALAVARANAERHHVADRIRFVASDLLAAVASEPPFDLIAANPPYVPESECASLEPQVRDWEPATALFAGPDGLDAYRRLIPQARALLKPYGWLLMEIGHGQEAALRSLLARWREVEFIADLQGIPRVAVAKN
jgi:release factor glutamine methyltransferase